MLFRSKRFAAAQAQPTGWQDVAIVGLSGRYPRSANVAAFWENLKAGRDCITEIPRQRWDIDRYFDEEKGKRGKMYSRWGGFIDGVDEFDPTFFNVSPREAEGMDPQERLFLQCVYETLEDAGYTREALARNNANGLEGNVGVFVGVMYEEYQLFGAQAQALGRPFALPGNPATIANRVSYFFNFHGPSMSLDTMCSSSLTAIHLACQSLQHGGCEVAVAGGVNVTIHPNKYLSLSQGHFIASSGRCESFGEGGDGFIPGEGVGAILLKPLAKALADGDHVYGVIRGTAVNHGGKTNGYSVPNPNAQANVIANALKTAGIAPREVSYIEAHGTGTKLGDPIEIAGLKKAFATSDKQFCAIGSAKSNIGHCESAAGIAGVTKVLLQLQHGMLAPSLHAETLNPHIDFADSPFVVQRELAEWKRPLVDGVERPRIAGISSFGAGGSNAHVLIEEFVDTRDARVDAAPVIVLSAKTPEQLEQQARNLSNAIGDDLAAVAYTLQTGREAMDHRLGFTASSAAEAREKLRRFVAGEEGIEDFYRGDVRAGRAMLAAFTADDDLQGAIAAWAAKGKYGKLLDLWVKGLPFDWSALYGDARPRRVSLPTYPFARERYWAVPQGDVFLGAGAAAARTLHPLLHENTSDFTAQRFSATFTGEERILAEHRVNGARVLPGVAYLEMARAAVAKSAGEADAITIENVAWSRPFTVGEAATLNITLQPRESGEVAWEVSSGEGVVHAQGIVASGAPQPAFGHPLPAGGERDLNVRISPEQLYGAHAAMGIEYGPSYRGVESVSVGADDNGRFAVARLALPASAAAREQYVLHPSLLDSALHASLALMLGEEAKSEAKAWLPFALDRLTIHRRCPASLTVVIREASDNGSVRKLDYDLCDDEGNVCVALRGFTARAIESGTKPAAPIAAEEALLAFTERWEEQPLAAGGAAPRNVVCILDGEEYQRAFADALRRIDPEATVTFSETWTAAPDALLYLRPLEARGAIRDYDAIVALLQRVAASEQRPARIVLAAEYANDVERCYVDSWLGFARSLRLVLPQTKVGVVGAAFTGKGKTKPASMMYPWVNRLWNELRGPAADGVLYESGKRLVSRIAPSEIAATATPIRRGGTYLITGGAGGIGRLVAERLAAKYDAKVILTGRSPRDETKFVYEQADVCDAARMREVVERAGHIDGVIHAAGVQDRHPIAGKSAERFRAVLAPKVDGTLVLAELFKNAPLDFFVSFSSSSAILGDFGSCDYAVANRFQTAHALARRGSVAINWPLWAEGTMSLGGDDATRVYLQSTGQRALETEEALDLFERLLGGGSAQQLVLCGDRRRVQRLVGLAEPVAATVASGAPHPAVGHPLPASGERGLQAKVIAYVAQLLSAALKLPVHRIDAEAPFDTFGIDSVMALQLTAELENVLGTLPKTLFFEFQTIEALAAHLVAGHAQTLAKLLDVAAAEKPAPKPAPVAAAKKVTRFVAPVRKSDNDVAIIAISGRYPLARDVDEFWENLQAGRDCVTEVPAERWDHSLYFDPRRRAGKTYSKWGGFIDDVDAFDPLFFNISPREARFMDPQERLFLETAWNLLERAGLTRDALAQRYGASVGVYVGSMVPQYGSFAARSAIANRVSYFFGLQGPSVTVDTMCSSAAVAIHNACGDLLRGDCRLAIAGGVNVSVHPLKYVSLSQGQLIGSHAGSRSFGDGDGYIPSEAVGAVLLKRLGDAIADGDEILAVIKATAINHGGRSNGYAVPSPNAQAQVIEEALRKANVDAKTIGCVEAAATGSALGDPIEVGALGKVFGAAEQPFCAIGSVKSNIGHAEGASAMAQLTKVVCQLRERKLVPSIVIDKLNPNLTFDGSAFRLQRDVAEWQGSPRRALVNSFGAGGSNACIVVEEYVAPVRETTPCANGEAIVVSAKNADRLRASAAALLDFVRERRDLSLHDVAYTLQVGREAMASRLAFVAANRDDVVRALEAFLAGADFPLFTNDLGGERSAIKRLTAGRAGEAMVEVFLADRNLEHLALLWTEGCRVPWASLHEGRIVALPGYPFERVRFPLAGVEAAPAAEHITIPIAAEPAPHALKSASGEPRNDLERTIAQVWEEALGVAGIGVEDSFLDLGGNSLQGAHIIGRLQEIFSVKIPMEALIGTRPTIAGLAVVIVSALVELEGINQIEAIA